MRRAIRLAVPGDREAIVDFCRHTWGPDSGDYIEHVIDRWLAGVDGALVVAELDGRAVACCCTKLMSPREAFLSGMRVDPRFRQSGLAMDVVAHCLAYAADQGRPIVRLLVGFDNRAALGAVRRARFRYVDAMCFWQRVVENESPRDGLDPFDRVSALVPEAGLPNPPTGALWAVGWAVRELTANDIRERAGEQSALSCESGLALLRPGEDHLWLAWLDGPRGARLELAKAALATAARLGFPRCWALLARDPDTEAALAAAGFERGLEYHVFERTAASDGPDI